MHPHLVRCMYLHIPGAVVELSLALSRKRHHLAILYWFNNTLISESVVAWGSLVARCGSLYFLPLRALQLCMHLVSIGR